MEVVGQVLSGQFGELLVRQKSGEELELGELLVADSEGGKTIMQVYNLLYGSQIHPKSLELLSGMELEGYGSDLGFMEPQLRNYVMAEMKGLVTVGGGKARIPKTLPKFFSPIRKIEKGDLDFLGTPENALLVGSVRSGSKDMGIAVNLDGKKVLSHHVLIPATTGRGKSLAPDEAVLIKDAEGRIFLKPIGPLVNSMLKEKPNGLCALSIDSKNHEVGWKPITDFLRHKAPEQIYKLVTTSGRSVKVTGDHNIYALREGKLRLLKTSDLTIGDWLPARLNISESARQPTLDLAELLRKEPNVHLRLKKGSLSDADDDTMLAVLSKSYKHPKTKLRLLRKGKTKLPLKALLNLPESLKEDIKSHADICLYNSQKASLPAILKLDKDILRLFGYYIAEGYINSNSVRISMSNPVLLGDLKRILNCFGLNHFELRKPAGAIDLVIPSALLARLLGALQLGGSAGEKALPDFFMNLSNSQLSHLLGAYFDGDGGVENCNARKDGSESVRICATTKSEKLSLQLSYALLRMGIYPRIKKTWKRASNTSHKGDIYYRLTISGKDDLTRFSKNIQFKSKKQDRLKNLLELKGNTNVDLVPIRPEVIGKILDGLKISQKRLSESIGCSQQQISLVLSGKRVPSRKLVRKLYAYSLRRGLTDVVSELSCLLLNRWDRIESLNPIPFKGKYVYDISVKDNETFLGGFGGIFVHNSNLVRIMAWSAIDKDYCGLLVLDPHDEYYKGPGGREKGLKDHPKARDKIVYYSMSPPAGSETLRINYRLLKPWFFQGVLDLSSAQRDALFAYYKRDRESWIDDILNGKGVTGVKEETLAVLIRKLSILGISARDGEITCEGVFAKDKHENTLDNIVAALEGGKTVVVDTSSLSGELELLISSMLASKALDRYKYRKKEGALDTKPVISIVIEEAPRVLGREALQSGPNVFSAIAREGRKFKVGLIAITQLPSLIPREVLANMNTKIILGIEMEPERRAIIESASQDLSKDGRNIASLDKGEALITSNFTKFAVPVSVPLFDKEFVSGHSPGGEPKKKAKTDFSEFE